jgi:ribA/ribD-fused uncharacterized protein
MHECLIYQSTEHAYQAAKTIDRAARWPFTEAGTMTCGQAKRAGMALELRPDWDAVKLDVMYSVNWVKYYRYYELRGKLLATGDAVLVEGNKWGDRFWGVCGGTGENNLGKILMQIRDELRKPPVPDEISFL